MSDTVPMITIVSIAAGIGVLGALTKKFGAESRPGFDERNALQ